MSQQWQFKTPKAHKTKALSPEIPPFPAGKPGGPQQEASGAMLGPALRIAAGVRRGRELV